MPPTRMLARRGLMTVEARVNRHRSPRVQHRHPITKICPFCGHGKKKRGSSRRRRSRKRRAKRRRSSTRRVSARKLVGARRHGSGRSQRRRSARRSIRKTSARRVVGRKSARGRPRNTAKQTPETPDPQQNPPKPKENIKDTRLEIPNAFQSHLDVNMPQHSSWAHPRTDHMYLQNSISHPLRRPGATQTNMVSLAARTLKPSVPRLCQRRQKTEGAALEEKQTDAEKKGCADEDHQSNSSRSSTRDWNAKIPQDCDEEK